MSSKGKCLKDYTTQPPKKMLVEPQNNENNNPNIAFKNELRNEKSIKKKAEQAALRNSLNVDSGIFRTSGLYGDFYNRNSNSAQNSLSPTRKQAKMDVAGKITREEPK